MSFLLVEWSEDDFKTYSVVSIDQLEDGILRANPGKLVGTVVAIKWKRNSIHRGLVLQIGKHKNLSLEADKLAVKAADEASIIKEKDKSKFDNSSGIKMQKSKNRANEITEIASQIPSSQSVDMSLNAEFADPPLDNETVSKEKYDRLKGRHDRLKEKYRELKKLVENSHEVELYEGSGVTLPAAELASIKIMSNKPTTLARNLFRRLFSPEELASHSLNGKICNANQLAPPLPKIDTAKSDAVIKFVLKEEGFDNSPNADINEANKSFLKNKKAVKREIKKSLSDFLREFRHGHHSCCNNCLLCYLDWNNILCRFRHFDIFVLEIWKRSSVQISWKSGMDYRCFIRNRGRTC
ncbi:uncharacterized protein LOC110841934 isoform X1 [Folsomia candida]|uniref:uncharacterized protein LOC110841934 isoform X1 n=1 Tax=Folsomia candida TaxID=158441 RepID=UPI001604AD01|nr:uncharacterized protein LOC110841934 isoform X1 [Folsomia candida]